MHDVLVRVLISFRNYSRIKFRLVKIEQIVLVKTKNTLILLKPGRDLLKRFLVVQDSHYEQCNRYQGGTEKKNKRR